MNSATAENKIKYVANAKDFSKIPGSPVAYWVSNKILNNFLEEKFSKYGDTKKGVLTGNDKRFLRLWFEVSNSRIGFNLRNYEQMVARNYKWIPETSGGTYRKWYGNFECVVNMENDSWEIRNNKENSFRLRDNSYYFKEAITWSEVSGVGLSVRFVPQGILFGNSGPVCFFKQCNYPFLGFLNSIPATAYLKFLSPTLTFGPEQIQRLPIMPSINENCLISKMVEDNISISKTDWDSFETSWEFRKHPLI